MASPLGLPAGAKSVSVNGSSTVSSSAANTISSRSTVPANCRCPDTPSPNMKSEENALGEASGCPLAFSAR